MPPGLAYRLPVKPFRLTVIAGRGSPYHETFKGAICSPANVRGTRGGARPRHQSDPATLFSWHRDVIVGDAFAPEIRETCHVKQSSEKYLAIRLIGRGRGKMCPPKRLTLRLAGQRLKAYVSQGTLRSFSPALIMTGHFVTNCIYKRGIQTNAAMANGAEFGSQEPPMTRGLSAIRLYKPRLRAETPRMWGIGN